MEPHPYAARHLPGGAGDPCPWIIHLEHHIEVQDAELEERAEMITNLEHQLLELQVQAPLEPADPEEVNVMLGIDED
jgi:hypothetical protein